MNTYDKDGNVAQRVARLNEAPCFEPKYIMKRQTPHSCPYEHRGHPTEGTLNR